MSRRLPAYAALRALILGARMTFAVPVMISLVLLSPVLYAPVLHAQETLMPEPEPAVRDLPPPNPQIRPDTQTRPDAQTGPNAQTGTGVTTFANDDPGAAQSGATQSDSPETAAAEVDFTVWERDAARTERTLQATGSTDLTLELLRAQLVDWRAKFLIAQGTDSARIATLRQQISALGPAPAEGETEADEIATRRTELNAQLATLQAPGLAADEAYRRADGLIREIDRTLRERQADALLQLLPSPLNPANWPDAARAVTGAARGLVAETANNWAKPGGRNGLVDNLPAILGLLLVALGLLWRGRRTVESLVVRLSQRSGVHGMRVSALVLSLGQILLPLIGVFALSHALKLTGLLGIVGTVAADLLPTIGFVILGSYWLGGRLFPKDGSFSPLALAPEKRAEGRFLALIYGLALGLDALRKAVIDTQTLPDAALSVLAFPALLVAGVVLLRLGRLLRLHAQTADRTADDAGFRNRVIGLVARAALIIGVVGPALAAIGYLSAAGALIFPAATSLGVIGFLFILQVLVTDVYALITRSEEEAQTALVPVLVGFGLVLASLPLFALIWGARLADLTELWTRVAEGFQLGDTRISPTNFMVFALVFAFGFTLTRLFQGALKGSVLPRTQMDQGARNAIVSGVGYSGIFFAALIAINSAGIDLSGLAIVAGALSVGIGFGLQNIVSNFVSGIILLIERPVSEGDWIEVGGVQGTVKSISVRSTRIQTFDRSDVIVPNTDLVAKQVTNWTRFSLSGRLIVPVGVAFGTDTRLVERVLREIADAQPMAVLTPPPAIIFMGFGADSMNFEIRVILRDVNFSLSVRTEINHQIVARFAEEGIEIPFAQSEITLRNASDIAEMLRQAGMAALVTAGQAAMTPGPATASATTAPNTAPTLAKPAAAKRTPRTAETPQRDHVPGEGLDPPAGHDPTKPVFAKSDHEDPDHEDKA